MTTLTWVSDWWVGNGYGSASYNLCLGLERAGVDVRPRFISPLDGRRLIGLPDAARRLLGKEPVWGDATILFTVPYGQSLLAQAPNRVGFSMFETTKLPPHWSHHFQGQRLTCVPCPQNARAFVAGGVPGPIEVVPLGLDVERYPFLPMTTSDPFVFLLPWADWRKGALEAREGFGLAFGSSRHHRLIIKTHSQAHSLKALEAPNVVVIEEFLANGDMDRLLRLAHCGLFPSRGEGYGLDARAMMLLGRPVILSAFGGYEPLTDYATVTPLPVTFEVAEGMRDKMNPLLSPRDRTDDYGEWAVVSPEAVAEALTRVYDTWSGSCHEDALLAASDHLRQTESYDCAAACLIQTLRRHRLLS